MMLHLECIALFSISLPHDQESQVLLVPKKPQMRTRDPIANVKQRKAGGAFAASNFEL